MPSGVSSIQIRPVRGRLSATARPPGSKSLTNRGLICAALASGESTLRGALDSDDTRMMIDCLGRLGVTVGRRDAKDQFVVSGCGGTVPNRSAELFVGNSGTTIRFLTAVLAMAGGQYKLDGIPRMRERPIGALADALNRIGGNVVPLSAGGCPPVQIDNDQVRGGRTRLKANQSSQYLSGMMMGAPLAEGQVEIEMEGDLVSRPYVDMTRQVMKSFGVQCQVDDDYRRVIIPAGQFYRGTDYQIEPDASAASYFWAAAAICGGRVTVGGLDRNSLQGDVAFVDCLERMGCRVEYGVEGISVHGPATTPVDVNLSDISDTAQTLAVVALFVTGTTTIGGIAHNRIKETDRIENLATELRKLGARVRTSEDGLAITATGLQGATLDTYDDHRMAMSLALAGLKQSGVVINNPGCVSKTYPDFFSDLTALTGTADERH